MSKCITLKSYRGAPIHTHARVIMQLHLHKVCLGIIIHIESPLHHEAGAL